jgi:hypothetical protein
MVTSTFEQLTKSRSPTGVGLLLLLLQSDFFHEQKLVTFWTVIKRIELGDNTSYAYATSVIHL